MNATKEIHTTAFLDICTNDWLKFAESADHLQSLFFKNSACLICKSCFFSETNLGSTVDTNDIRRVLLNNSKIRFHQYCWCFRGSIPISVLHLSIDYLSQHDHQNSISQETKKMHWLLEFQTFYSIEYFYNILLV